MKMNPRVWFCVIGLALLTMAGGWHIDSVYGQQGGGGGSGGGKGGSGGGGGFGAGGFGTAGSVAANAEFVYVLQNNTLTQLSANDLTEVKKVTLKPAPETAGEGGPKSNQRGAGGGGGQGGGGSGFGGGQGGGGGFGGGGSSGSVAANADYVYVLQDHTLTQFAAKDLTQIKQSSTASGSAGSKRGR